MEVYKYLTPDRIDVLRGTRLRFAQPAALNDPFELKPYFDKIVQEEVLKATLSAESSALTEAIQRRYLEENREFRRRIPFRRYYVEARKVIDSEEGAELLARERASAIASSRDLAPMILQTLWDKLDANVGILSLTRDGNHPLMWSHYADSHRGFVIGFEDSHPFFHRRRSSSDEFYHLRPVQYRDRDQFAAMTDLDGTGVLASKLPEWEYEQEWRILSVLKEADLVIGTGPDAVYLYSFPPEAISSVTLGLRTPRALEDEIRSLVRVTYPAAEIRRATLSGASVEVLPG